MNGPDDVRDEEVSRRYRALPPELPQPDTDAAIRAAARQALAPRRTARQRAWLGGLAMAASVTLVMAVLLPSWRSGEWQEQVAARAPADAMAEAPAPTAVAETSPADAAPVRAAEAPRAAVRRAAPAYKTEAVAGAAPAPADSDMQDGIALPVAPAPVPAPVMAPAPAAETAPADVQARESARHERAAAEQQAVMQREQLGSQKARMARPLAAAPGADGANGAVPTVEGLLLADRHAEALALLQSGPVAGDAGLESRRDLLRQLVPGASKTLKCRSDSGPDAARALCRLLQGWQAGKGLPVADMQVLEETLRAEGTDPAPWRQAVTRLH